MFQTPSAGRWVLQHSSVLATLTRQIVSNPISGEVGAAASTRVSGCTERRLAVSNPISGEVGAAAPEIFAAYSKETVFQTPSAGRWVLQRRRIHVTTKATSTFQTPSAGRWVLQRRSHHPAFRHGRCVSNPISGEVGAANSLRGPTTAKRWERVSNPISGEVGAATDASMGNAG